ncbi:hypothetical protein [Pedobacter psychroterrae]|uniref:hypothetical protein n=1 Tax=Pedobacter psychroterrae TaxID=2530453 RepID=UPI001980A9AF|nr:hypothetical protein [Pedobacter psychroterrae]
MKAAVLNEFGSVEKFEILDVPTPKPGFDEDYEKENYIDAILDLTDNKGVDVVIDTLGGNTL